MTLIIGMNFGSYALLAADARTCYYPPGQPTRFKDDTAKVRLTQLGLVAGTGLVSFIDAVAERLETETIVSNHRIQEIVQEEKPLAIALAKGDPRTLEGIENTCWMATYITKTGDGPSTLENAHMRVAVTSPRDDYDPELKPVNSGSMNVPFGMSHDDHSGLCALFNESFVPFTSETNFAEHLSHHLAIIRAAMRFASECCETVASRYQIGAMNIGWAHYISPVLSQDDETIDFKWDFGRRSGSQPSTRLRRSSVR